MLPHQTRTCYGCIQEDDNADGGEDRELAIQHSQEPVSLVNVCHGLLQCVALQLHDDPVYDGANVEADKLTLRRVRDDHCYVEQIKEDEPNEVKNDKGPAKNIFLGSVN